MNIRVKGKNKQHHPDNNMITVHCQTKGYYTHDAKKGGYLIQSVYDILSDYHSIKHLDLVRLTERIKRRTAQRTNNMNCPNSDITVFDMDFYFRPN